MKQIETLIELLFGKKYYAITMYRRGTSFSEMCSYIFESLEDAKEHAQAIDSTATYSVVEIVSFRSRTEYQGMYKKAFK